MNRPTHDLLDELWLDMEQLCRLAGVEARWLHERVAQGLVPTARSEPLADLAACRFDALALHRVRRMARLERDFDAVPELAALVTDLEDEIRALRRRLALAAPMRRRG